MKSMIHMLFRWSVGWLFFSITGSDVPATCWNQENIMFISFCVLSLCIRVCKDYIFLINTSTSKLFIWSSPYWYVSYLGAIVHMRLYPIATMILGWNVTSIVWYYFVSNIALVSGDVTFGSRWEMEYKNSWWWLKGLDEMMIEPVFAFWRINLNWCCWLPSGDDATPKYLYFSVDCKYCIFRLMLSLDDCISIILFVFCLFMHNVPLSMNSHMMRDHTQFVIFRPPPEVWSIWSQLLATVCRFLHIIYSKLSFRSLTYYHSSFTSPMICLSIIEKIQEI